MPKAERDMREDIGGGLLVYPVSYVPKPDWNAADKLPRCVSKCPAALKEPLSLSQMQQFQAGTNYTAPSLTYMCAVTKYRVTEQQYCVPALVALREKASKNG